MNKYRIGSNAALAGMAAAVCCAVGEEEKEGVLTGGRGRPAREDQSEDARGGAMGMAIARLGRCIVVDAVALLLLLSPWTLNG
jgi:hypothetical protein